VVRLINAAGAGTVTGELKSAGHRVTIRGDPTYVELVARAEKPAAAKKPTRRKTPLFDVPN